jgi:periplasmic protein TonB
MSDHKLLSSFAASSLIHLILVVPVISLMIRTQVHKPQLVHVQLVDVPRVEEISKADLVPPQPQAPKPKTQKIAAPKLLSKTDIFEIPPLPAIGNIKKEIKEPEKPLEKLPPLSALPPDPDSVKGGWNLGSNPGEAEGSDEGAGHVFGKGDVGVVGETGLEGGGGGQGISGLGRGAKGEGAGGGSVASGEALSGLARPLGGYQVKPRYPVSARRAGAQGITLLKLRVLENGKVGEVQIEQSAGHADLDNAAVDAVKRWLFEPARMGKIPVAVWVLLPVKFELQ